MELHTLPKTTQKSLRRVGRGHGTGRGKTAGRGTKGQKARRSIPLHFEGGALPLTKRMPFLRGKGRNPGFSPKPAVINVSDLNNFTGKEVTIEALIAAKLVRAEEAEAFGVKVLGNGELTQSFIVKVGVSASAKAKIEKAGGTVES